MELANAGTAFDGINEIRNWPSDNDLNNRINHLLMFSPKATINQPNTYFQNVNYYKPTLTLSNIRILQRFY